MSAEETKLDLPTVGEEALAEGGSGYRNMFVPLVVVPALIVVALVAVFTLFGAVGGAESTVTENIERIIHGGAKDREHATFNLARQMRENGRALEQGHEQPHVFDSSLEAKLSEALESTQDDDLHLRVVLSYMLAKVGSPSGLDSLISLLETPEAEDADGSVRFEVLVLLAVLREPRATDGILEFMHHEDAGLRAMATIGLQGLVEPRTTAALQEALNDPEFQVRANAALALSHHGEESSTEVLEEMLEPETYQVENERDRTQWTRAENIQKSRVKAVEALARLGRPQDLERLSALSKNDGDLAVREAALRALRKGQGD